jgi:hypothetical protein
MTPLEDEILAGFYRRLGESSEISPSMLADLQKTLASASKIKPDDFIRIFSAPPEDSIP